MELVLAIAPPPWACILGISNFMQSQTLWGPTAIIRSKDKGLRERKIQGLLWRRRGLGVQFAEDYR